ncbi:MAG: BamA/TamA family outer membrane protein, partial [Bacteroidota bacterium]
MLYRNVYIWVIVLMGLGGTWTSLMAQERAWPKATIAIEAMPDQKRQKKLEKALSLAEDSLRAVFLLNQESQWWREKGYLENEFHWQEPHSKALDLRFQAGPLYLLDSLRLENVYPDYLLKTDFKRLIKPGSPLAWEPLEIQLKEILLLYQNEGYPFASFRREQLEYLKKGPDSLLVRLRYYLEPGEQVIIDSLHIEGKPREKAAFLYNLIQLQPGDIFNQSLLDEIPRILNNSIYYQKVSTPEVVFTSPRQAEVKVKLEKKQASKLDVLLGILPPINNDQRIRFSGSVDVALVSPFRLGEQLALTFNNFPGTSQQLGARVGVPYLFRTPISLESDFSLFRQEEDFQNLSFFLGGTYTFSPGLVAKLYLRNRNTRLLRESLVDTTAQNLAQLDGRKRMIGLGLEYEKLDYRLNPSRGWHAQFEVSLGQRQILENGVIKLTRPDFYEGLRLTQFTQEISLKLAWYYSFFPRQVLHLANQSYWLGLENYFRNDQIQVGGSRSIRGFNENQYFTDAYTFFTLEYRFQLERDSYLFVFGDYAYVRDRALGILRHPYGTGIGMNYGT